MHNTLTKMVISSGDPYGIGPEVTVKALNTFFSTTTDYANIAIIWIGPLAALVNASKTEELSFDVIKNVAEIDKPGLYVIDNSASIEGGFKELNMGKCIAEGGEFAYKSLDAAIDLCLSKEVTALVTAPISKEAMQLAKSPLLGHTEYLAKRAGELDVVMILAQNALRVALLTVHVPLIEVIKGINNANLTKTVRVLSDELIQRFSIKNPRIAVLGLNPHAGENGYIGNEELTIISPFIEHYNANEKRAVLFGPFAADGFFGSKHYREYDAVLAMYHDQGLVGFKSLAFGGGVNVTAGLPFVRTSPDHGTAYTIAEKNTADASSMLEAILLALKLSTKT